MTKEEAYAYIEGERPKVGMRIAAKFTIDKIYDDLESRVCKNCEYWEVENSSQAANGNGMCKSYTDAKNYYAIGITHSTYGCNKWYAL